MLPLQSSPRITQFPPAAAQVPFVQTLSQHCTFDVQAWPDMAQVEAVEHLRVAGSQKSEQHSLDSAQVAPAALHWFGPLQRSLPSMS